MPTSHHFDTIIVGSGLAGLSAARKLAQHGQNVIVLEKAKYIGGHLLPFQRYGWSFEVGVHYIADTQAGSYWANATQELGINIPVSYLDNEFERVFAENNHSNYLHFVANIDDWIQKCKATWSDYHEAWHRFETDMQLAWRIGHQLSFPIDLLETIKLIKHCRVKESIRLLRLTTMSVEQYFLQELKLPKAIYLQLSVQHLLIGCPPKSLSALLFLLIHRYYLEKPCAIDGGGLALRDALLQDANFKTQTEAEVIQIDASKTTHYRFQIQTTDNIFTAQSIIWTPDPRILQRVYTGKLGWLLRTRLNFVKDAHCLVVCYFATKRPLSEYGFTNSNDWLLGQASPSENYHTHAVTTLAQNNLLYLSTGSIRDAAYFQSQLQQAKKTCGGLFQAMFLVPPDVNLWGGHDPDNYRLSEEKKGFRKAYIERKQAVLDIIKKRLFNHYPALAQSGELIWQEVGTPLTHRRYLASEGMNGYGYQPSRFDLLFARPHWRTGVTGLYLSGSFLRPAHGLSMAMLNGLGVAKRISENH